MTVTRINCPHCGLLKWDDGHFCENCGRYKLLVRITKHQKCDMCRYRGKDWGKAVDYRYGYLVCDDGNCWQIARAKRETESRKMAS